LSNAVALETDKPPGAGLNWRHRKRRKALIDGYVHALGGHVSALQRRDVERAADLIMLAEATRAKALRGEVVRIEALTRLEITADKAIRRLNLPVPSAVGNRMVPLRERLRGGAE
jgi:hypothetical protein